MLLNNQSFLKFPTSTPSSDPYWNNVVLFLKGDGTNGSTNIIDSSPTPKTITVNGDTQISTTQSKYGGSSIKSNTGYLTVSSSTDFNFTTENFTIEFWYYPISIQDFSSIINWDGTDYPLCLYHGTDVNLGNPLVTYSSNNNDWFISGQTFNSVSTNTWVHLAMVRSGNNFYTFNNGVLINTQSSSSSLANAGNIHLFRNSNRIINCYLDSLRITKGVARYTSNFNPETDTYLS